MHETFFLLVSCSGPKLLVNQPKLAQQDRAEQAGMCNEKPNVSTI